MDGQAEIHKLKLHSCLHRNSIHVHLSVVHSGSHEDQLYIHPSDRMEEAVRIAIEKMSRSTNAEHAVAEKPNRVWKHAYLATSASRTPAIVGKTELAVRKPLDYPFG